MSRTKTTRTAHRKTNPFRPARQTRTQSFQRCPCHEMVLRRAAPAYASIPGTMGAVARCRRKPDPLPARIHKMLETAGIRRLPLTALHAPVGVSSSSFKGQFSTLVLICRSCQANMSGFLRRAAVSILPRAFVSSRAGRVEERNVRICY